MPGYAGDKERVLTRLRRIEGQVREPRSEPVEASSHLYAQPSSQADSCR